MVPFGGFLLAVGLIMALAVADRVGDVDLSVAGWIIAGVGVLLMVAGLVTANSARKSEHRVIEDRHVHTD